jgi:hypothetical protein
MMPQPDRQGLDKWIDKEVVSADGETVGRVKRFLIERVTEVPAWAVVQGGLLESRQYVVPLGGASFELDRIVVEPSRSQVADAPEVEIEGDTLSPDGEKALDGHFGLGGSA